MMGNRYYVQRLTEQVFVVRERLSADGEPAPDDHIVRSFAFGEEAYRYAEQVNERSRAGMTYPDSTLPCANSSFVSSKWKQRLLLDRYAILKKEE
jgi:hypothetical protein